MKLWVLLFLSLLVSCGAESNFNGFFVTDVEKQNYESLIEAAQAEYDLGNYEQALALSSDAERKNPQDPDAVILGAFAALGNARLDPVNIGKSLFQFQVNQESSGVDQGTENFLSELQVFLRITEADLALMGTRRTATFDGVEYIYYEPKSSEDARASLNRLSSIKQVLDKMCAFVPATSKIATDVRHQCSIQNVNNERQTSIQFLWALAHLGESLYFNSILLYAPDGQETPTIQAYGEAIANREYDTNNATASTEDDIVNFVSSISTLANLVDSVFSTQNGTPMITSLLNNLDTAQLAISAIPSVPDELRDSISKSSETINGIRNVLQQSGASGDISNAAVRADLLKSTGDKLLDRLSDSEVKDNLTEAQIDEACIEIKNLLGLGASDTIPPEISNNAGECN